MNNSTLSSDSRRAVIYARNNQVDGLERNLAEAVALAARRAMAVAEEDIIAECGSAATIEGRIKFEALLEEIEHGGVSHLITTGWDRLARTSSDVPIIEAALEAGRVILITDAGVDDYSRPSSIRELKGMVAQLLSSQHSNVQVYGRVNNPPSVTDVAG